MKEFLIITGAFVAFINLFSIEFKTNSDAVNQTLHLPAQIPLKDIIFNTRKDNNQIFYQVYLALNDSTKLIN